MLFRSLFRFLVEYIYLKDQLNKISLKTNLNKYLNIKSLAVFTYISVYTIKLYLMNSKEKFFSVNNAVTKKEFKENFQKLNYQRKSISDIENKHKEWSRIINENFN